MSKIVKFEDLEMWQIAKYLYYKVFKLIISNKDLNEYQLYRALNRKYIIQDNFNMRYPNL